MIQDLHPLIVPLVFAVMSVGIALLSRRGNDPSPIRNELYVGRGLFLGSLSASFVYLIRALIAGKSDDGLACTWVILVLFSLIVLMACVDRYYAWEEYKKGRFQRKLLAGVWAPNVLSMVVFAAVFMFGRSRAL